MTSPIVFKLEVSAELAARVENAKGATSLDDFLRRAVLELCDRCEQSQRRARPPTPSPKLRPSQLYRKRRR